MMSKPWRSTCFVVVAMLFFCTWILTSEALGARAGGGRSIGSRGSRTTSPPKAYTAPQTTQPSRPGVTPTSPGATPGSRPYTPPAQDTGGFWRSVGGGVLGGLAGGFLYRSLFGGPSATATPGGATGATGSSGSSFGLMDILILGGIAFMIYYFIKSRRREPVAEGPSQYASEAAQPAYGGSVQPPYYDQPATDQDLERGLNNIRQYDPGFDDFKFKEQVMDIFFKVQGAWASHDMSAVKNSLTDEMFRILQEDSNRLKQDGKINKLESVAVRSADITEAWQEGGQDFLTVRLLASLLDYTVDARTGDVLEGSKTEPVKFEEYWTFTRPLGSNPWQLSAISQPA
jgi:predicted lipid-binding transport protein (Tim44 family)